MYHKTRHKVHTLLHPELNDYKWNKVLNGFIILLIVLNVVVVMLETVQSVYVVYKTVFYYFDLVSLVLFSIEYVLRVWTCVHDDRYRHPVYGRLRYMTSPGALIDLLAILPFYLHVFIGFDFRELRIIRLFRLLRLLRLTAYMKAAKLMLNVFRTTFNQLMLSLVLTLFLVVVSSCLVYFSEHTAQPQVFSSIPETIWWSVITLTTVGYGNMVPVTVIGKIFTSIILFAGVALFALPAGIITAGFLEETRKEKKHPHTCPHCHLPIDI